MNTTETARFNMIEQQIRPCEVLDYRVLKTLKTLDRANFVQETYKSLAYADCQIPLGNQTHMLSPIIEARMLQSLFIQKNARILEIGSGSGYFSACLALLGKHVLSLDTNTENLQFARQNIARIGLDNIEFKQADGLNYDAPEHYDAIAVTGSVRQVPENLKQALHLGGRMFIVVGESPIMQAFVITRATEKEWVYHSLFETDLPTLRPH